MSLCLCGWSSDRLITLEPGASERLRRRTYRLDPRQVPEFRIRSAQQPWTYSRFNDVIHCCQRANTTLGSFRRKTISRTSPLYAKKRCARPLAQTHRFTIYIHQLPGRVNRARQNNARLSHFPARIDTGLLLCSRPPRGRTGSAGPFASQSGGFAAALPTLYPRAS